MSRPEDAGAGRRIPEGAVPRGAPGRPGGGGGGGGGRRHPAGAVHGAAAVEGAGGSPAAEGSEGAEATGGARRTGPGAAAPGRPAGAGPRRGPARAGGRRSHGEEAARRIRRAAADLFWRQGYQATGLRQVAAAAGVAVGTVYTHYQDKPSLLRAVAEEQAVRLARQLARVHLTPGLPAGERWVTFRRVLEEALPWLACEAEAAGETAPVGAGAGSGPAPAAPWPVTATLQQGLARFLEEGARRGEIELLRTGTGSRGEAATGTGSSRPAAGGGIAPPPAGTTVPAGSAATATLSGAAALTASAVLAAALGLWQAGCARDLDWLWRGLGVRTGARPAPGPAGAPRPGGAAL